MASGDERDDHSRSKRVILIGFANWSRWSTITKDHMREKGVWDLTGNAPAINRAPANLDKANGLASKIIHAFV